MKILTESQFNKLTRDKRLVESANDKIKGVREAGKKTIANLRDKLSKAYDETERSVQFYEDKLAEQAKKHKRELEKIEDAQVVEDRKVVRELEAVTAERDALAEFEKDANDLERQRIELEAREQVVDAREKAEKTTADKLATITTDMAKKVKEAEDTNYKKGYADGVADGVREGAAVSAEDRKNMANIAMMAAASHTPEAAKALGMQVAKGVANALTAGTDKPKS